MKKELLRSLPSTDELVRHGPLAEAARRSSPALVRAAARQAIDDARQGIMDGARGPASADELAASALAVLTGLLEPKLRRVVNATGTIIHTNIGRAPLAARAVEALATAAGAVNLEYDLENGARGERDAVVSGLVSRLTGAEEAIVVNNNAAAVLLALNTLAEGREVVVSRGELIEIGGSFRLPDIIRKSGCVLREVGTTNRTHPADYDGAVNPETALMLRAHASNYRVVGFTAGVGLRELCRIAARRGLPVVEDLGSGSLVDLARYGLPGEPVVAESIRAGASVVTFSADKLLGGPQAGILAGKKELVDRMRKNPLKRALRADKLTLAALEATLRLYLEPEKLASTLPVLRLLARPLDDIERTARQAACLLRDALGQGFTVEIEGCESVVGGGALPGHTMPSWAVSVSSAGMGADSISRLFLSQRPPVLGHVSRKRFLLDMRTVEDAADVVPSTPLK